LLPATPAEAFCEPVVDRRKQIAAFDVFTLVSPEASEAGSSAQFPQFGTLPFRDGAKAGRTRLSKSPVKPDVGSGN
jgi:hypothetical protein